MKRLIGLHGSKVILALTGCLPMMVAFSSQAEEHGSYKENGWFVGGNIGKSSANINGAAIRTSLENSGFAVSSLDEDTSNEGFKAYVGYQFGPHIALEGGYFDLGDFSFQANTLPVSDFTGNTRLKGWDLDLVGILPVTERFSAFARIGFTHNKARTHFGSNGLLSIAPYDKDDSYNKHKYGIGVQYDVSAALTVRVEAERYRMDDLAGNHGDIDLYSLGLVYRFGEHQSPSVATVAPEPVAAPAPVPPTPAPVKTVTTAPEVLELEDVHFNFDTAELTSDTKVILRQHVQTLKANPDAKVRIAGYTSASGTKEYNQALSKRRAESIKAFLVHQGVAANRFKTIGFGERKPAEYEAQPTSLRSDAAKANMRGLFEIIIE